MAFQVLLLFALIASRLGGFRVLGAPSHCPEPHRSLLDEYKRFHDANKNSPDARYLVQTCWGHSCQGTGDRLRGTMWCLRIAIAHKRILLVDWTQPAAITNFLLPNEIDWTATSFNHSWLHAPNELDDTTFRKAVYEGQPEAVARFAQTKIYHITTNEHFYINMMANVTPVDYSTKILIGSCYYHFLFKLNETVIQRANIHLHQLYGPQPPPYMAWHWRHGDADGKQEAPVLFSHLTRSIECARSLAAGVNINLTTTPMVLISDFNAARQFVLKGMLNGIVTPNITARHIDANVHSTGVDKAIENHIDTFTDIFSDLYILSRARCMLTTTSGFSKAALWMSGSELMYCHRDWLRCTEEIIWRRREHLSV